jgi:hypothetical protein
LLYDAGMRSDVEVRLGPGDRERLEAVLADRNSGQKHVWRARIILATAESCGTMEIMRRVSKPCVWRWQRRFMEAGVDGLLRDKTRKPGRAPVPVAARLIERTLGAPPAHAVVSWSTRSRRSRLLAVFAIGLAGSAYLSNRILQQQNAREEVLQNARIIIESAQGAASYTVKEVRPLLTPPIRSSPAVIAEQRESPVRNISPPSSKGSLCRVARQPR